MARFPYPPPGIRIIAFPLGFLGTLTSKRPLVTLKIAPLSLVVSGSVIVLLFGAPLGQSGIVSAAETTRGRERRREHNRTFLFIS